MPVGAVVAWKRRIAISAIYGLDLERSALLARQKRIDDGFVFLGKDTAGRIDELPVLADTPGSGPEQVELQLPQRIEIRSR